MLTHLSNRPFTQRVWQDAGILGGLRGPDTLFISVELLTARALDI